MFYCLIKGASNRSLKFPSSLLKLQCREEEPRIFFSGRNFNTPKYMDQLSEKNQQVLICGRLHFQKHFDQQSRFNMENLY